MSNLGLPLDTLLTVLSLLPVKPLVRFKSVSKEWYSLINGSHFIKLHLKQSTLNIIFKERQFGRLLCLSLDSANLENPRELNHPLKHRIGYVYDGYYDTTRVLGSCDGLLCLKRTAIALWNVSTGDYMVLPEEPRECGQDDQYTWYGFGYDSIHDDYKLVRFAKTRIRVEFKNKTKIVEKATLSITIKVTVYSLRTNSWEDCEEIPGYYITEPSSTFVHGALHCLGTNTSESRGVIIAFDVGTDTHHQIELPDMGCRTSNIDLRALRGCLCMTATRLENNVHCVWIMEDYGVKESWTMTYILEDDSSITYLNFLRYDLKGEEFNDVVDLPELHNSITFPPLICTESLVKLGDHQREDIIENTFMETLALKESLFFV